jgi:hypothetical protein
LEDKIGLEIFKPLLISQEGAFFLKRSAAQAMDSRRDRAESGRPRDRRFTLRNLASFPPSRNAWPFRMGADEGKSGKKGVKRNEPVQG